MSKTKSNTLVITGNGFDLYHNLKSSYSDFYRFLMGHKKALPSEFDDFYNFSDCEDFWNGVEHHLLSFSYEYIYDARSFNKFSGFYDKETKIYAAKLLEKDLKACKKALSALFLKWIAEIEKDIQPADYEHSENGMINGKKIYFLSFNYTHVLEKRYKISKRRVCHIHNSSENKTVIFGCSQTDYYNFLCDWPKNGQLFYENKAVNNYARTIRKPIEKTWRNKKGFFERIKSVSDIYVLGHSLDEIDLPYFIKIAKKYPLANWHFSSFSIKDSRNKKLLIEKCPWIKEQEDTNIDNYMKRQ